MKIQMYAIVLLLAALRVTAAAEPETGSIVEQNKTLHWEFTPDPALPNVLILGDSISIGYTLEVRKLLAGKANVFRPMTPSGKRPSNCGGTTLGVQRIDQWLAGRRWAVIHFNWGLHDMKHVSATNPDKVSSNPGDPVQATVEVYRRNLQIILGKLQATGARLIFATTTPVPPGTTRPLREPESPARYNAAALSLMTAAGIRVDDLFSLCQPELKKWQLPRNVHFNPEGSTALARQVADTITEELNAARPGHSGQE